MNAIGVSPQVLLITVIVYFALLYVVSYFTSRNADTDTFFRANNKSPWILVAIGMIGASLSGVTFISIPGVVGAGGANQAFSWMQMVLGFLVGYAVIALILMPIYYRMNLTSIYGYLENRFGFWSYKFGAFYFILSRIIGASFRLYLVAMVLHPFVLGPLGISFELTIFFTLLLIWIYTFKGGIKTIVWTDTIQTITMLVAVCFTIYFICEGMGMSIGSMMDRVESSGLSQIFFFENGWPDPNNFYKQFVSGALIAIVMTGLDQDMMQKNLTCKTLGDAQKNILVFSIILIFANLLFISLGAILYIYAGDLGIMIPDSTDQLFPLIALQHLPPMIGVVFIIGLIAAAYSSADSALTALTTSFCVDFLDFEKRDLSEKEKKNKRLIVHVGFTVILFLVIFIFNRLNNDAVINGLFKAAGYTYGPLLGLYTYGILTKLKTWDKLVPLVVIASPIITFVIDYNSADWFGGFTFGFFVLALNGLLTFLGLLTLNFVMPNSTRVLTQ